MAGVENGVSKDTIPNEFLPWHCSSNLELETSGHLRIYHAPLSHQILH
jgi:hypothetical protein